MNRSLYLNATFLSKLNSDMYCKENSSNPKSLNGYEICSISKNLIKDEPSQFINLPIVLQDFVFLYRQKKTFENYDCRSNGTGEGEGP